jgi:hypothetical protein
MPDGMKEQRSQKMKIEIDDNAFWAILFSYILIFLISVIVAVAIYGAYTKTQAFEKGYEQTTDTGTSCVVWKKVRQQRK